MKKLLIEDVQVGISRTKFGGCGPIPGYIVAEVRLRDIENGTITYYSLAEVEGIPNFFETDASSYNLQIEQDPDEEEAWDVFVPPVCLFML